MIAWYEDNAVGCFLMSFSPILHPNSLDLFLLLRAVWREKFVHWWLSFMLRATWTERTSFESKNEAGDFSPHFAQKHTHVATLCPCITEVSNHGM